MLQHLIIGVPKGEEQEQKIENLSEQIMKENFPNLVKETDLQEVQEAQRVPCLLYTSDAADDEYNV